MNIDGLRCLVTGGAGFIGSHVVDALTARGCAVRVLDNFANGRRENVARHLDRPGFDLREGSVTDGSVVADAMAGVRVVFHLACLGVRHSIRHPYENHLVNAEGTLRVLQAALAAGVERFVCCSSSEVYGSAEYVPMPESHPTRPCTVYGASKLAGESYARAYHVTYGLPVTVVRPFNTYGPRSHHEGDAGEAIPKFIVRALAGLDLQVFGDGLQTRDFTFVEDTAAGLVRAAECDGAVGKTLNLGSGFEVTIREVAERVVRLTGSRSAVDSTPPRPGDVRRLFAEASAFVDIAGWRPSVGFDEGLARTIQYFRDHPAGVESLRLGEVARNW